MIRLLSQVVIPQGHGTPLFICALKHLVYRNSLSDETFDPLHVQTTKVIYTNYDPKFVNFI